MKTSSLTYALSFYRAPSFLALINKFPHSQSVLYIRRTNLISSSIRRLKSPKSLYLIPTQINQISRLIADSSSDRSRTERNLLDEQFKRLH
ncbi:hypothetical protein L1987_17609 [Smallanthus sonchifolius]|uniref:Uncharacterized protein n=1 Tax=Smallanthus sonchifolius TaxID=185202 RepID=A0ACB9IZL9_9ASTR|nr:hypothetical protein L1987_17609 [Smallanthus sonchifolius]